MNLEKLKDAARKHELKEDWHRAIEVYQRAIEAFESGADGAPDLTVYNRVGDLQLRVNDTAAAVGSYERAAELYAEQGFVNNAIALCGKILRVNPGRVQTYLHLAQLHARKNVVVDAKRNLLEYLERMHAQGRLEEAFGSIRQFAAQFAASPDIRQMLAELLRAGSRSGEIRAQLQRLADELDRAGDHAGAEEARARIHEMEDEEAGGGLVFLDTGVGPPAGAGRAGPPPLEGLQRPDAKGIAVERLEIETGRADESAVEIGEAGSEPLPGLETTAVDVSLGGGTSEPPRFEGLLVADSLTGGVETPAEPGLEVEQAPAEPIDLEAGPPGDFELSRPGDGESLGTAPTEAPADYEPLPSPVPPSLDELADRVLDQPESAEAHRALGEALLAAGERERGREELELALERYEGASDWVHAGDVLTELIRLDPVSIRLYQKRVELGFRMGDRTRLLVAYLELADCLVRVGSLEKAEAVYRRVLEHDPSNERARAALDTIVPPPGATPPRATPPGGLAVAPPAGPGRAPAAAGGEPGYVDLGAMVLGDATPTIDTRIRVEDEEPTGDEEADFQQILQQFKTGLERSLAPDDFQTHYDLGIAFREMGLLDEAIAEFQKALRAPEGRLRTAEALGGCFFEKGQYSVAGAILRRAVDTLPGADDEKIGLLYWLGRAEEEQGRGAEAVQHYQRALAVDIGFRDVNDRLGRLAGGVS